MGVTQIPNPTYTIAIATASQATLQTTDAHHGIVPNNPDLIHISVNFSPQQLIVATTNNPPTINALAFTDLVGVFIRVLELEFSTRVLKKICSSPPSFSRRMKPSRCFTRNFSSLKGYFKHHRPGSFPSVSSFVGKYSNTPCAGFATTFCRI